MRMYFFNLNKSSLIIIKKKNITDYRGKGKDEVSPGKKENKKRAYESI